MTLTLAETYVAVTCGHEDHGPGNFRFAMTRTFYNHTKRTGAQWYCPMGHVRIWTGDTTETQLEQAKARETALQDQLRAAIREGDAARLEALRIRQRIVNGVCPCCTRSFPNVMRHMAVKHPDFAMPDGVTHAAAPFRCSCGNKFETYRGLRVHQGHLRDDDWDDPDASRWRSHLAVL